ncbi:acyl-CoA thioesterase [Psychrobium sp. nBUS_13]|uniref:acyl-CoA thioesterase n=1 Tax=Psychrobium sp. nBUS_13 TaxID=3395319 RepID=UPI003EC007C8
MFSLTITPRFLETDALGHINNTVFPMWFESGRDPIFMFFTPNLDVNNWKLMLGGISVSYHAETHFGSDVEIKTFITRIGNSSFDIYQECWQNGVKTASGKAAMIHYCHNAKKSVPLTEELREKLQQHMLEPKSNS